MTQEQKAKAYDKALEDMRVIYPNLRGDAKLAVEHAFPQLTESEDERIRKLLVWQVHRNIEDETNDLTRSVYDGIKGHHPDLEESIEDWKKCLAWLERQKDLAAIPDDLVKNYKLFCEQGGRELALLINAINGFNKQKEQKSSEWSEEDKALFELLHQCVCRCINDDRIIYGEREKISKTMIPFIEKLQALHPQSKVEWSDEDEKNLKSVVSTLWFALNTPHFPLNYERIIELEGWLKSLRPQPHWKPSQEQMKALKEAYESYDFCDGERGALESLYNYIKKL